MLHFSEPTFDFNDTAFWLATNPFCVDLFRQVKSRTMPFHDHTAFWLAKIVLTAFWLAKIVLTAFWLANLVIFFDIRLFDIL